MPDNMIILLKVFIITLLKSGEFREHWF